MSKPNVLCEDFDNSVPQEHYSDLGHHDALAGKVRSALRVLVVHNRYRTDSGENFSVDQLHQLLTVAGHTTSRFEARRASTPIGIRGLASITANAIYSETSALLLEEMLDKERFDVAHVHNLYPILSPSILEVLQSRNIPIVMSLHNYRLMAPCGNLSRNGAVCTLCTKGNYLPMVMHRCRGSFFESVAYAAVLGFHRKFANIVPRIDRFLCPSQLSMELLALQGVPKEKMAYLASFVPQERTVSYEKPRHILYAGRLVEEKGLQVLLSAAEMIPEVPITIAGVGPLAAELKATKRRRELRNVTFVGHVGAGELQRLRAESACAVLPSTCYENAPYAALESLAASRPVVASDVGGLPELVEDGVSGYLVPPGRPELLAHALRRIWTLSPQQARQMANAAGLKGQRFTDQSRYVAALEKVYRGVVRAQV